MIKIRVDSKETERSLRKSLEKELKTKLRVSAEEAVKELKEKTPKDTGAASESWKIDLKEYEVIISNDKDYVKALNAGSSKQAPSHFIESVLLKYGKPKGQIVTYEE